MILLVILTSCSGKPSSDPASSLSGPEQDAFVLSIIRYAAKSPDGVLPAERFFSQYDSFYLDQASRHRLEAYQIKNGKAYFMLSRPAPSLKEKRLAIGGFVVLSDGRVADYREVFRTWKMHPDTLTRRSHMLFGRMVDGLPLEQFEARFTGKDDYIEFPDDRVWFDTVSRSWALRP